MGPLGVNSHPVALHVITRPEPLRTALLRWYEGVHAARGMPWRKPFDPSWDAEQKAQRAYEVWVSEIMLQQTQVVTVIPYYNKWMEKFPTIRDLASSNIDVVNSLWKGLGYYSRAARLLAGAQKAVEDFGGRLPDNAKDMESRIPGIGRYSAGAICSIAYNECVPVLDGNVHRLLSRLLALHAPPKAKQTLDILWGGASALVKDANRPGDLNQALIELGSTVCKVRDPSCGACPLNKWCVARAQDAEHVTVQGTEGKGAKYATSTANLTGGQEVEVSDIEELCTLCEPLEIGSAVTAYPMKAEKKKAREELDVVNVIEWRRSPGGARWFLLVRRPDGGLLAGLHEFPTAPDVPVTTPSSAQIAIAHTLLAALLVSPPSTQSAQSTAPPDTTARRHTLEASKSNPRLEPRASDGRSAPTDRLRVMQIEPAGDVLHIFSHIRKTYRIQWVVLEGGPSDEPPPLVRSPELRVVGAAQAKPKTSKGNPSRKKDGGPTPRAGANSKQPPAKTPSSPPPSMRASEWVLLDRVADANIGTGVVKIWRQVRTLWEGNTAEVTAARNDGEGDSDNDNDAES
ncbi:DNA glycosylase [Daedaleopsis nitida]|nr:DNA glycosylase [Daedaleopsis nitida]